MSLSVEFRTENKPSSVLEANWLLAFSLSPSPPRKKNQRRNDKWMWQWTVVLALFFFFFFFVPVVRSFRANSSWKTHNGPLSHLHSLRRDSAFCHATTGPVRFEYTPWDAIWLRPPQFPPPQLRLPSSLYFILHTSAGFLFLNITQAIAFLQGLVIPYINIAHPWSSDHICL